MKYTIGIDEAGRGPLAGPVAVGAVKIPANNSTSLKLRGTRKKFWKGIKDSKKLSAGDRELWYKLAHEARKAGELDFAVSLVSEKVIDKHGISYALRLGIKRCLKRLEADTESTQVFLDGALRAPDEFEHQLTVIKGDEKIPIISLASILAKVTRDRKMVSMGKKFPKFDFATHKGYGTLAHRKSIMEFGSTDIHRKSFIKRLTL